MKRIRWTADARRTYRNAIDHISDHNALASKELAARVRRVLGLASERPFMFRPGTREASAHPNYVVVYRVEATTIVVVAFIHARRRYP